MSLGPVLTFHLCACSLSAHVWLNSPKADKPVRWFQLHFLSDRSQFLHHDARHSYMFITMSCLHGIITCFWRASLLSLMKSPLLDEKYPLLYSFSSAFYPPECAIKVFLEVQHWLSVHCDVSQTFPIETQMHHLKQVNPLTSQIHRWPTGRDTSLPVHWRGTKIIS